MKGIDARFAGKAGDSLKIIKKKSRKGGSQEFNREASNKVASPLGKNPAELDVNH